MIELFFGLASLVLVIGLLRWFHVTFPRASNAVWTTIVAIVVLGGIAALKLANGG